MKSIIFLTTFLFLTGCVYAPAFWEQDPRPTVRPSPAFFDNVDQESRQRPQDDGYRNDSMWDSETTRPGGWEAN